MSTIAVKFLGRLRFPTHTHSLPPFFLFCLFQCVHLCREVKYWCHVTSWLVWATEPLTHHLARLVGQRIPGPACPIVRHLPLTTRSAFTRVARDLTWHHPVCAGETSLIEPSPHPFHSIASLPSSLLLLFGSLFSFLTLWWKMDSVGLSHDACWSHVPSGYNYLGQPPSRCPVTVLWQGHWQATYPSPCRQFTEIGCTTCMLGKHFATDCTIPQPSFYLKKKLSPTLTCTACFPCPHIAYPCPSRQSSM